MLIYLDLETTGLEEGDRICSLAIVFSDEGQWDSKEELVKPPRKIRPEAMAVHHITNEMVREVPSFEDSEIAAFLKEHNRVDNTLVAHNISFDLSMLAKEGFVWQGGIIDTLKCSRHLIDEIDYFSLQYLRYELGLYRNESEEAGKLDIRICAHNALSDAFHVMLLHRYLNEMADDRKLQELSVEPVLIKRLNFGKYKEHYLEEVAMNDAAYLRWMLEQNIDEDLQYSIRHYLETV
ncbi:exonuclease domain-containing protein [Sulfurimonas sp. HSL3-7]|uniref:exonuclease domain-containing protein n=1 Tax=Sulfonitrofixus jiaomeiensis TaxID=3131938 RepID=UPI0031F91FEF